MNIVRDHLSSYPSMTCTSFFHQVMYVPNDSPSCFLVLRLPMKPVRKRSAKVSKLLVNHTGNDRNQRWATLAREGKNDLHSIRFVNSATISYL